MCLLAQIMECLAAGDCILPLAPPDPLPFATSFGGMLCSGWWFLPHHLLGSEGWAEMGVTGPQALTYLWHVEAM